MSSPESRVSTPDIATITEIVDMRDVRWFCRNNWKLFLAGGVLGLVTGFVVTYFFPVRYHSEARVRFMPPQLAGHFVNPNFSMEVEQRLYALSQLLSSRLTATRMIESFQLYPERRRFQTVADLVPQFLADLQVEQVASGDVAQKRAVPTMALHFRYREPVQAQKVVQKLVEQVYEENRKYRGDQSMGTTEFLGEQLRAAEERMLEAEARLGEIQDAIRPNFSNTLIGEGTSRSYVVDSRLRDLRHDRRLLEERRSVKNAEIGPLEAEIRSIDSRPPDYYFPQVENHPNYWHLAEKVSNAKTQAVRMRERWKPGFPDRELAELDLREAEQNMNQHRMEQARLLRVHDRERAVSKLLLARNELRALEAQEVASQKEEMELRAESQRLKERHAAPAGMETDLLTAKREYETAKEQHSAMVRKHEESLSASDMERRGQGETVELLDPPTLPSTPDAPTRPIRIAVAAFAGIAAGILIALLKALRDPKILHEGHIEKWAGLEVLAMFPAAEPKKKSKKRSGTKGKTQQTWRRRAVTTSLLIFAVFAVGCTDRFISAETLWKRGQNAEKESTSTAAMLFYRQAIRKDPRFAPAYRSAGLLALQTGELMAARDFLARALEFEANDADIHTKLADLTYQLYMGDAGHPVTVLREVEALAAQITSRWPRRADGYRILAQVLMERHRTEEAVALLHDARSKVDNNETLDTQAAAALFRLGRNEEAHTLLRDVMARSPRYSAPYDLLYLQLMQEKNVVEAGDVLARKWRNTSEIDAALQLAAHYDAFRQRDEAKAVIAELENLKTVGAVALARIGDFWMVRGQFDAAHASYQRGRRQFPDKATEYISRIAEWHLAQNQQNEAKAFIEKELAARPKDAILRAYASAIALNTLPPDQREAERKKLEAIVIQLPDSPFIRYHMGRAYLLEGRTPQAAEQFERCVKLDPNYAPGWVALANLEIARGNPAAAELRADNVLRIDRNHLPAILVRARAQISRGKSGEAEKALDFLLSVLPRNADAIYLLAAANRSLSRPEKALELLAKGREVAPNESRWVVAEAEIAASQGNTGAARATLEAAIQGQDKPDESLLRRLATMQIELRDGAGAARSFERLRNVNPGSVDYRLGHAGSLALAGDVNKALSLYTETEKMFPQNAAVWLQHAALLSERNDKAGALAKYQEALAHDKNNPLILNNLSWMLLESGGPAEKALEYAQQARRVFGRSREIDDTLAAAYSRLSMFRNASAIYEEMLAYLPPPERPRVQKLLETTKRKTKGDA